MIQLRILDKNGRELCDGDMVKTCSIQASWQEEGDYGYRHQVDTIAKWIFSKVDIQGDLDNEGFFMVPGTSVMDYEADSFRAALCELSGLPPTIDDEEFNDCVFDYLCSQLDLDCKTLEELEFAIEGFEIVDSKTPEAREIQSV